MARCVVLHTSKPYSSAHTGFLRSLYHQDLDLVAIAGADCEAWEEAMDYICIDLDTNGEIPGAFCNTTSHAGESLEEVVAFAEQWCELKGWPQEVEVVEI